MKRHIFLFPLFVLLVIGCPSDRSGDSGHSGGAPADEGRSATAQEQVPSSGTSELEKKLGSLGFQTPTDELMAIDFSLKDLSGRETTLSSFAGKVVFLNFWATWCGPCRAEIPSMVRLYAELGDEGFTIVAVNSQELENQVSAFVEEAGMSFPVLLDSTGKVGTAYSVRAIPTTYIIDSRGAIRGRMVGTRDWYSPQIISLVRELQP
jgi:thiol-disulfide isomerase/thioredoxin